MPREIEPPTDPILNTPSPAKREPSILGGPDSEAQGSSVPSTTDTQRVVCPAHLPQLPTLDAEETKRFRQEYKAIFGRRVRQTVLERLESEYAMGEITLEEYNSLLFEEETRGLSQAQRDIYRQYVYGQPEDIATNTTDHILESVDWNMRARHNRRQWRRLK